MTQVELKFSLFVHILTFVVKTTKCGSKVVSEKRQTSEQLISPNLTLLEQPVRGETFMFDFWLNCSFK